MTLKPFRLVCLIGVLLVPSSKLYAQDCGHANLTPNCRSGASGGSSSSASSNAQERVAEINRATAQAQEAIKEDVDRVRDEIEENNSSSSSSSSSSGFDSDSDSSSASEPDVEPYISDSTDKNLPAVDPLELQREHEANDLLSQSQQLLQLATNDCNDLRSTSYPGAAPSLPPQCVTDLDHDTAYIPGGRPQPQGQYSPEPVIDGSTIPSIIDFTLSPSPSAAPASPTPDPSYDPTPSPTPSSLEPSGSSLNFDTPDQRSDQTSQVDTGASSTQTQKSDSQSDSSTSMYDRIMDNWKDFRVNVGNTLRGKPSNDDGPSASPTPSSSPDSSDADMNQTQNPANLSKGVNRYDSDLHDKVNQKIDDILNQ